MVIDFEVSYAAANEWCADGVPAKTRSINITAAQTAFFIGSSASAAGSGVSNRLRGQPGAGCRVPQSGGTCPVEHCPVAYQPRRRASPTPCDPADEGWTG